MKRRLSDPRRPALALAIVAVALAAASAQQPSPEELQQMMERHREAAKPGPEHEWLAGLAGEWDLEIRIRPAPGAEPLLVEGTATTRMILGGRFLMQTTSVAEGLFAGESMTLMGFDRRSGEFNLLALDTHGTYWVAARGPRTEDGTIVLSGEDHDAIVGGTQLYDFVLGRPDADTLSTHIVFKDEMHTRGGPPFTMVETTARRRK